MRINGLSMTGSSDPGLARGLLEHAPRQIRRCRVSGHFSEPSPKRIDELYLNLRNSKTWKPGGSGCGYQQMA
jgi:hypothetical protein